MIFEIKQEVFIKENLYDIGRLLSSIFDCSKYGQYTKGRLYVDTIVLKGEVFKELGSIDRALIEKSYKENFNLQSDEIDYFVSNNNQIEKHFEIQEAIMFLSMAQFLIIIENSNNDSPFIKAIINNFEDKKEGVVAEFLANRWIQFIHAGGSTTKAVLKSLLDSYSNHALTYNSLPKKYLRALVILDSDKEYENHENNKYDTLIDYFNDNDIDFHILEKRAMENYMPLEVIQEIKNIKSDSRDILRSECIKWIDVYLHLNEKQRDYLNFTGYSQSYLNLPKEIKDLFEDQQGENFSILERGFKYKNTESTNLNDDERRFKNAFPRFFETSTRVNRMTLKKRANSDELELILDKIKNKL